MTNNKSSKIALTIAGSDPSGGAGFQADLRAFKSLGVYGVCVPTVLTAQNTGGVHDVQELTAGFFSKQIDVLLQDIRPDAVKTGMIYTLDFIRIIADKFRGESLSNLVIDPVAVSSTGVLLMEEGLLDAVRQHLFPLSKIITPNIYEASVLSGIDIKSEKEVKEAAVKLKGYGPDAVIITGGHLESKAVDLLFDGSEFLSLENDKLEGEFHGTGCVFSSVVTASLALGYDLKEAFVKANDFTFNAMKNAESVGKGMKVLNI